MKIFAAIALLRLFHFGLVWIKLGVEEWRNEK